MFRAISLATLLLFASVPLSAQDRQERYDAGSIGFQVQQVQRDFGVGGHVTTPFLGGRIALRVSASGHWLDHTPEGRPNSTWDPYLQLRIGGVSRNWVIPGQLSIYGEGGFIFLRPNESFSQGGFRKGGYGIMGVEAHFQECFAQFFEIGGVGTGAHADRSVGNPLYSNGLHISAGMRWYW